MNRLSSVRLATVIFALVLLIVLLAFLLFSNSGDRGGHWWISLLSMWLAVIAMYGFVLFYLRGGRQARRSFPSYAAVGTVIALYGAAVLVDIMLFWLIGGVSLSSYTYIHVITAALAAIGVTIALLVGKGAEEDELQTKESRQLLQMLQATLFAIRSDLDIADRPELAELKRMVAELEEQVKYSDPMSHPTLAYQEENMLWQAGELQRWVRGVLESGGGAAGAGGGASAGAGDGVSAGVGDGASAGGGAPAGRDGSSTSQAGGGMPDTATPLRFVRLLRSDLAKRNQQLLGLK